MPTNRYSLSDYILTLTPSDNVPIFGSETKIEIGGTGNGEGSYLGSISVKTDGIPWKTEADATGSWVHEFSYDRHGTVTVKIRQVSDQVLKLISVVNYCYTTTNKNTSFGITLSDSNGNDIVTCTDCYISKIPDQNFSSTTEEQDWIFTCGKIEFSSAK